METKLKGKERIVKMLSEIKAKADAEYTRMIHDIINYTTEDALALSEICKAIDRITELNKK